MKLFLASMARDPKSIQKLEEFVGGFTGKTLAYVPTAGNAEGWESWREGQSWDLIQTLGMKVSVVQLEDYQDIDLVEELTGKDIIWFAGGSASYLAFWLIHTGLNKRLKKILEQGSIYVGSSAGSMVASKTMQVAEWYIGETEPEAKFLPGLGLVDFDIYPHYRDESYKEIEKLYKGKKLYLLKDGEEIIVDDDQVTVVGEERVITQ
jgi:dipeptidase E